MLPKILIVDDREENLLSIEAILGDENYFFVRAGSGEQALRVLLNESDFALILMDVNMPVLNGFETAELIYERKKLRRIPIVFVTAYSFGDENMFKGFQAGAVDYISKPVNPGLLRAKVAVFVELYQKSSALLLQEEKLVAINKNLEREIKEHKLSEEKVKALNIELLKNISRLEVTNKDLDRFAFMASHDLQEPLRKIRMFSDRLATTYNKVLDETGIMYISRIQNSAERMQALIRDILTFSKTSAEKKSFVKTDMNELLKDVIALADELITEKSAVVNIAPLPALEVNVSLMQPLFYNLVNNALKYAKRDVPPVIDIYTDQVNAGKEEGYCRILVRDNGIGFNQQYAEQIFSMFTRLHDNSEYSGTGIGLALCKKIVEDHGGTISAQSEPDKGSVFVISLPVSQNPVE